MQDGRVFGAQDAVSLPIDWIVWVVLPDAVWYPVWHRNHDAGVPSVWHVVERLVSFRAPFPGAAPLFKPRRLSDFGLGFAGHVLISFVAVLTSVLAFPGVK